MFGVFLLHFAFGLHHKFAVVYKNIHYVNCFVEQSPAVAAQVEDNAFQVFVAVFQIVESGYHLVAGFLCKLVEFDVSETAVHHTVVRHGFQFYLLAGYLYVVGLALTFYFHSKRGAGLSAQYAAYVGHRFAFGRFAVDFHDFVAGFESCFSGGESVVGLGYYHIVAALRHHGAYAAVLPENLQFHVFDVRLGYVVGVGVEGAEHGVDGGFHKLAAFEVVHVVEVEVFIYI